MMDVEIEWPNPISIGARHFPEHLFDDYLTGSLPKATNGMHYFLLHILLFLLRNSYQNQPISIIQWLNFVYPQNSNTFGIHLEANVPIILHGVQRNLNNRITRFKLTLLTQHNIRQILQQFHYVSWQLMTLQGTQRCILGELVRIPDGSISLNCFHIQISYMGYLFTRNWMVDGKTMSPAVAVINVITSPAWVYKVQNVQLICICVCTLSCMRWVVNCGLCRFYELGMIWFVALV